MTSLECIVGKIFISNTNEKFGRIRLQEGQPPDELASNTKIRVLAEDECGNYFIVKDDKVFFWDHETSYTKFLADTVDNFILGCSEPDEITLKEENIESVWIDEEFLKIINSE